MGRAGHGLAGQAGMDVAIFKTFRNMREINRPSFLLKNRNRLEFIRIRKLLFLAPVLQKRGCVRGSEIPKLVMFPSTARVSEILITRNWLMSKPLQVLVVEDSEDDTLFLVRELKRGGFDPTFQRVDNLTDLSSALDLGKWDVIVSDHTLPGFGSIHALELVRQRGWTFPSSSCPGPSARMPR